MQKKRKYWSCIKKNTDFYELTREKQIEALINGGVYFSTPVASSPKLIVKDNVLYLPDLSTENLPTEDLKDEFYEYILNLCQGDIDNYFYIFFKNFNDSIFGMEFLEQKKIARELFKEIYNKIDVKSVDFINLKTSNNGIENVEQYNRFSKLKGFRRSKCSILATVESLISFLGGNEAYFKSVEFLEHKNFLTMLYFEKQLKVLISLNDRFQLFEDIVFTKLGRLKDVYMLYENLFINFDVFVWVEDMINSFRDDKAANIESLYQSLLDLDLVSGTKKYS